jgi:hypothetical protein
VHTLVHRRVFGLHFGPFLLVLQTSLHAVLCCRRHDFAAQTVGFVGRSGFSGNLFGVFMAGLRSVGRVQVCGIRTLLPGAVLVWLIPLTPPMFLSGLCVVLVTASPLGLRVRSATWGTGNGSKFREEISDGGAPNETLDRDRRVAPWLRGGAAQR